MRNLAFWSALLLACLVATPAVASVLSIHQHNSQGSLTWRGGGHVLGLHSDAAHGVVVTRAASDGTWGLHQGDVILAVDGHPLQQVEALVERLRASKPAAVQVRVRRGHAEQTLTLAANDYEHLISPKPPAPPTPPAPPAAPLPPPPRAPPSGG